MQLYYSKSKVSFQSSWKAPSRLKWGYPEDGCSNFSETLLTDYETTWRRNREDDNMKRTLFYVLSPPTISSHTQQTKPWPAVNPISTSERLPITQPPQHEWTTRSELENLPQLFFFSAFHLCAQRASVRCDVDFIVRKSGEERNSFICHTMEPSPVLDLQLQNILSSCRKITKWHIREFSEWNAVIFRWRAVRVETIVMNRPLEYLRSENELHARKCFLRRQ